MTNTPDPDKNRVKPKSTNVYTILVIDDDESFLKLMSDVLTLEGHSVITAANGEDGIDRYMERRPDLVFLDLVMPGINGLDVLKALMKYDAHAKIIVITGYGSVELAVKAMQDGAVDFLEKVNYTTNIRQVMTQKIKEALNELR